MVKTKKSRLKRIVFGVILTVFIVIFIAVIMFVNTIDDRIDGLIFGKDTRSATKIFYYDYENRKDRIGTAVELENEEIFLEKSEWRSIYEMPENLKNAFIAVEDKRFYEHSGVDWLRTLKATLNHFLKFDKSGYGGSTITQQLIKNVTGENEFSIKRKVEEIFRAIKIEKNLSKNQILENYLNIVYMSQNCYGVSAASMLYFEKDISELSLAECASLASIVQNPTKFDPYRYPKNNENRRKIVLNEMLKQGMINEKEYSDAINENVHISTAVEENRNSGVFSWYTETLIDQVAADLSKKYDLNVGAAKSLILKGGFNIYSVIDPAAQKIAEKVYESHKAYIDNQGGRFPQSACVVLDPYTSDILAIVGGVDKKEGNLVYNRATRALRPPASVLKPLSVYAPGLEEGVLDYSTVYDDAPIELSNGKLWPKNSPDRYRGLIPTSYAVAHSVNTVAVKAIRELGLLKSKEYLSGFGINIDAVKDMNESSLALGQLTNGESLLNITNAYTAFTNGGFVSSPKTYLYVTDTNGNLILKNREKTKKVISEENAYIMTMMLKKAVESGTASSVKLKSMVETAGKTGTSSGSCDKWFVGYTPYYTCGIWTGFDTPTQMNYVSNPSCELFDAIMQELHKGLEEYGCFKRPSNVIESEYCFDSGEKPSKECKFDERGSRVEVGYFIRGKEPKAECKIHESVYIDKNGQILNGLFSGIFGRRVSLLNYDRKDYENISILDSNYLIKNRIN